MKFNQGDFVVVKSIGGHFFSGYLGGIETSTCYGAYKMVTLLGIRRLCVTDGVGLVLLASFPSIYPELVLPVNMGHTMQTVAIHDEDSIKIANCVVKKCIEKLSSSTKVA